MMVEFALYYSLSNVFHINDNELKKYLSDICRLKYIIELGIIKKDDIKVYSNNIFNENNIDKYNIYKQISELKEAINISETPKKIDINYNECYGC
jgi:hypothetical protein